MNTEINSAEPMQRSSGPGRWFWILLCLSIPTIGAGAYLHYARVEDARHGRAEPIEPVKPAGLPVIAAVPDFTLTERSGKSLSLADLRGKVWVADFFFTTCGGPCPIMTNRMRELQQALKDEGLGGVVTVSFTVDPETDTPEQLRDYARMFGADPYPWHFLTGEQEKIFDLSIKGFKLAALESQDGGSHEVEHSPRFILVDKQGRIRGYYEIVTDEEINELPRAEVFNKPMNPDTKRRLLADIRQLLRESSETAS